MAEKIDDAALIARARDAAKQAYAPYSKFRVGAALLAGGKIYSGCNVENASYGLTNCAERTAVFSAVAAGERKIEAIAIYTDTDESTAPCGACRQVLSEFGGSMRVILACRAPEPKVHSLGALLPLQFHLNAE